LKVFAFNLESLKNKETKGISKDNSWQLCDIFLVTTASASDSISIWTHSTKLYQTWKGGPIIPYLNFKILHSLCSHFAITCSKLELKHVNPKGEIVVASFLSTIHVMDLFVWKICEN